MKNVSKDRQNTSRPTSSNNSSASFAQATRKPSQQAEQQQHTSNPPKSYSATLSNSNTANSSVNGTNRSMASSGGQSNPPSGKSNNSSNQNVNVWKARQQHPTPQSSKQQNPSHKAESNTMHERMLYLLANLVGMSVRVTLHNGTCYEGIFHGATTEGKLGVVLNMAQLVDPATNEAKLDLKTIMPKMIISPKDLSSVFAVDVDLSFGDKGILSDAQGFQTDTDISKRGKDNSERVLEKWSSDTPIFSGGLEETSGQPWDQFEANEKLFGIKTDYKEEFYTTKLDKESESYKKKEREASRLAAEIEKSTADNIHLAEERGQIIDDSQMNEEDRYGAVVRKPGSYIPPAARKQMAAPTKITTPNEAKPEQKPSVSSPRNSAPPLESPKTSQNQPTKQKEDLSSHSKKSTLDPNASSFKFNLKAVEFKPTFGSSNPSSTSVTPITPSGTTFQPSKPVMHRNIFGKSMPVKKSSIKSLLFENYSKQDSMPDTETIGTKWEFGNHSFMEVVESASSIYSPMPVMNSYGYQYTPQAQAPMPFPIMQQPFAQYPPQMMYGGAPPQYMQPPPQAMPMQYAAYPQPVMIMPNQPYMPKPPYQQQPQGGQPPNRKHGHDNMGKKN